MTNWRPCATGGVHLAYSAQHAMCVLESASKELGGMPITGSGALLGLTSLMPYVCQE